MLMPLTSKGQLFNNFRPNEHQKALDDIQKKIREEKEIQKLEEEAMKQYISHFSIDR